LEYLLPRLFPSYRRQHEFAILYYMIAYPDIESPLDKDEWQGAVLVRQANPHFAVHQQAVVQVHDAFLDTSRTAVDFGHLLSFAPCQPVQAKQVPILGLYHVFFGCVPKGSAEIDKVGRIAD
jgi:hypothetical protein